jgi:hypothetical protein
MFNNIENGFWEGFSKFLAINNKERKKSKATLKDFIEGVVKYIDEYISEVFFDEFWSKPYRIYDWETIDDVQQLKKQLLNEAWFQDIDRNDELYYDDEKEAIDYENIHVKLENDYKLAIDLSLELFLSYLKRYPQIRKEIIEVEFKESKSTKPITRNIYQIKLDPFVKLKKKVGDL